MRVPLPSQLSCEESPKRRVARHYRQPALPCARSTAEGSVWLCQGGRRASIPNQATVGITPGVQHPLRLKQPPEQLREAER